MTSRDRRRLTWPPGGVDTDLARRAIAHLLAHHDRPSDPDHLGTLDPAGVAAAVGAEQLARLVRSGTEDAEAVQAGLDWLRAPSDAPGPVLDADVVETVEAALEQVVIGLTQRDRVRPADAAVINAEAGHHMVITDGVLLRAAVRAGNRTADAMPYYDLRYGRRGRRFVSSDSAWLVAMGVSPWESASEQVTWLAGVLATRGMPSLLLEVHLTDLADELELTMGEPGWWQQLRDLSTMLADRRRTVLDDDVLDRADEQFAAELPDGHPVVVPRTGTLVVAAVVDAALGITETIEPCVGWLADPDRFDDAWCDAVRRFARRSTA